MSAVHHFLETQPLFLIYTAILLLVFLENTVPVAPGDAILIFTAYLAGRGTLSPTAAYCATVLAAIIGYAFLYYLGRTHGRDFLERNHPHLVPHHRVNKVDYYFHRYGYKVLAIGRFVPGTRFIIGIMAGFTRMRFGKSMLYTGVSIVLWNLLIFALGNYFTDNWDKIKILVRQYNEIMLASLIVIGIGLLAYRYLFQKKKVDNVSNG